MKDINPERLLDDLRALAEFGRFETGVDRIAFSDSDIAARQWLRNRLEDAGLEADIDRWGNVYGRARDADRAVLIGSHTDTVPRGGWLDGALGVIYGLEIARTLGKDAPVDVISFQDEEGSYVPCLGSKSFCGVLDEQAWPNAASATGDALSTRLAAHDLPSHRITLDKNRVVAFFEAHIEQGPRLETAGCPIGVVTGIVGIRRFKVCVSGRADHAGTTPIELRRDAGAALIQLASAFFAEFRASRGKNTVWNIGSIVFEPGAANVVPAEANMVVEFRDTDPIVLDELQARLFGIVDKANAEGNVEITMPSMGSGEPVQLDEALAQNLAAAARGRGIEPMLLPSGAGHDAMVLGRHIPAIMMFVPSIGGRSHHVSENTSESDIATGCQVMADAVMARLQK